MSLKIKVGLAQKLTKRPLVCLIFGLLMCSKPFSVPENEQHYMFMVRNNQPSILFLNQVTTSMIRLGKSLRFAIVTQIVFGH